MFLWSSGAGSGLRWAQETYSSNHLKSDHCRFRHTSEILWVQLQISTVSKYHNTMSCNFSTGGGSCLRFSKNTTSVKRDKKNAIKQGSPIL